MKNTTCTWHFDVATLRMYDRAETDSEFTIRIS